MRRPIVVLLCCVASARLSAAADTIDPNERGRGGGDHPAQPGRDLGQLRQALLRAPSLK
jgi:hypothetical protein